MCRGDVTTRPPTRCSASKIMKPMLPRKITSSARINLNKYWNVLEEMVMCSMPFYEFQDGGLDADMSNEINENLANERLELGSGIACQSPDANPDHRPRRESNHVGMAESRSHEVGARDQTDSCMESGSLDSDLPVSLVELSLRVIKLGA